MSKKPQSTRGDSLEAKGPAQDGQRGYNPQANPSDQIFQGSQLPLVSEQAQTLRRPFTLPVRSPLHYNEGPGTDEVVTSRRPMVPAIQGNLPLDMDHGDYRPEGFFGVDKVKEGNKKPGDGYTSNGVEIRGT